MSKTLFEKIIDREIPASFVHEQEKVQQRWPAAVRFIEERGLLVG